MAVRESVTLNAAGSRRAWFVAACLVVLFLAALFLRAYWNLDAANPEAGEFILSGGSDPYYHKHAVDMILADANGDGRPDDFTHYLGKPVDKLLNYPLGSENPNPPLFEWSIAVPAVLLAPMFDPVTTADGTVMSSLEVSAWYSTIWAPAIYGALTVFVIYAIGAALFDRRAGLVAALLWTVSTSAIDSGGVGLADHDSAVVFFVSLSMLFYIQALRHFRGDGLWVRKWSDGGAIGTGFAAMFRERRSGFAFALAAAFSIGAVALTWKGFNYVLGIILLYAIIQMIVDHWRNKDSTGLFTATLIAMVGGVLVALPYYATANVGNFLQPTWYMLGAFLIAGLVLVPTRDLPTILVLPIAAVVGLILAAVAFFVFPTVAQSLLYATVYFKKTNLYETIAEAHPADFSTVMFGVGPLAFFLAIIGWVITLFRVHENVNAAWTRIGIGILAIASAAGIAALLRFIPGSAGETASLIVMGIGILSALTLFLGGSTPVARVWSFAIVWAIISVFMAQSAVRFLINAIPVFCLFAGFMTIWIIDWLDFGAIRKSLAANRGNFWQGFRKGVRPLHIVAVVLIAFLFVVPTTLLAADAALPPEAEAKLCRQAATNDEQALLCNRIDADAHDQKTFLQNFYTERMGAYGQGFGQVKPWLAPLGFLAKLDDYPDPANKDASTRPAFISWWDYGHWAIAIGDHPAVADNFQNGYELAANFILSQDEAQGIQLLAARLALAPGGDLDAAVASVHPENASAIAAQIRNWEPAPLTIDESAKVLAAVEAQTGKKIRYFATDSRMLPYDNPQTESIESGSIFYAPVKLKGDEPDDYVTTQVRLQTQVPGATPDGFVTVPQYERVASDPVRQNPYLGQRYVYQEKFVNSAYWRHYAGTPVSPRSGEPLLGTDVGNQALRMGNLRPAYGLEHWRAIYVGPLEYVDQLSAEVILYAPQVVITEYFPGAVVTGQVTEDGVGLAGVAVTVYDDLGRIMAPRVTERGFTVNNPDAFNVPHQQVMTGPDGTFSILAPFSTEGGNVTFAASRGGVQIGRTSIEITRAQANGAECAACKDISITAERGNVEGIVFHDANNNNERDDGEALAANVTIEIGGKSVTTDAEGKYRVDDLSAGTKNVTTSAPGVRMGPLSRTVDVYPKETATYNLSLEPLPAKVSGNMVLPNGTAIAGTLIWTPDREGAQPINVFTQESVKFTRDLPPGTYNVTASENVEGVTYEFNETIVLAAGDDIDRAFTLVEKV